MTSIMAVVPAYNAQWCLSRCLSGLLAGGFAPQEVVVVDDGSTDNTQAIAREAGVRLVASAGRSGAAAARNLGARTAIDAGADLLLFVDSDVVVHADVRDIAIGVFTSEPDVDAVFGAYDNRPARRGLTSQYRNLLHHHVHMEGPDYARIFWTGCGAVRVSAFQRVDGFDPAMRMMEDVEFGNRLSQAGGLIRLARTMQGKHLKCWTLGQMVRMDIFDRAIPWSRLMLFESGIESEFNLSPSHRLSAIMVLVIAATLAATPFWPPAFAITLAAAFWFVMLNMGLFRVLRKRLGLWGAIGCMPLHMVHYGCAMTGLGWIILTEFLPSRIMGRAGPERRPKSGGAPKPGQGRRP